MPPTSARTASSPPSPAVEPGGGSVWAGGRGFSLGGVELTGQQLFKPVAVEYRHAELLGLGELGAGTVAGNHVIGLLRHRSGHLAAGSLDHLAGLVTGQAGQRPGQDDRLAFAGTAFGAPLGFVELEAKACLAEPADDLGGLLVAE